MEELRKNHEDFLLFEALRRQISFHVRQEAAKNAVNSVSEYHSTLGDFTDALAIASATAELPNILFGSVRRRIGGIHCKDMTLTWSAIGLQLSLFPLVQNVK